MKSVMKGAKNMRFDQYADHCIVSKFRLHCDSHLQILTAKETPLAPTLARSNLIRLSCLNWPSWLLLPAASALSRHLVVGHPVSLYIVERMWNGAGQTLSPWILRGFFLALRTCVVSWKHIIFVLSALSCIRAFSLQVWHVFIIIWSSWASIEIKHRSST